MLKTLLNKVRIVVEAVHDILNPPEHIRLTAVGTTIEECLRDLERQAELPIGDLGVTGRPYETCSFPIMRRGMTDFIKSKLSERWRELGVVGYISGSVTEMTKPASLDQEQLDRLPPIIVAAVAAPHVCIATLHISKNCPGVYRDNVCTTCGDRQFD